MFRRPFSAALFALNRFATITVRNKATTTTACSAVWNAGKGNEIILPFAFKDLNPTAIYSTDHVFKFQAAIHVYALRRK